ncbi:hypothetical protein [Leptolyngbya sp. FACHB-261]|uniref:hypothetical protein n=1 Tax=Leptolyngbya sp. FACHB-261 TaxID=2692806 RepID=UPI001682CE4C|nr:hypothetical protein [Leptolyngbya sp. FACHB-261]MBD2100970.1 hypothetical protein [Leptolyngbya sp. FACHB-261]
MKDRIATMTGNGFDQSSEPENLLQALNRLNRTLEVAVDLLGRQEEHLTMTRLEVGEYREQVEARYTALDQRMVRIEGQIERVADTAQQQAQTTDRLVSIVERLLGSHLPSSPETPPSV